MPETLTDYRTVIINWMKSRKAVIPVPTKLILAIDPGSEGALGLIFGSEYHVIDIPTMKVKRGKGKKTIFNHPGILELFASIKTMFVDWLECEVCCVVETPPPSMGPGKGSAYGQFRLGCSYAMWPLFLLSLGFKVEEVSPGVWKRKMGLSSDKETSRSKAMQMFAKAPLQRKKDHNRAEALLLAEYHKRKLGA